MDFRTITVPRDSNIAEYVLQEIIKIGRHESIHIHKDLMCLLHSSCIQKAPCKNDNSILHYFKNSKGQIFAFETVNIYTDGSWFALTATIRDLFYTFQKLDVIPFKLILES